MAILIQLDKWRLETGDKYSSIRLHFCNGRDNIIYITDERCIECGSTVPTDIQALYVLHNWGRLYNGEG